MSTALDRKYTDYFRPLTVDEVRRCEVERLVRVCGYERVDACRLAFLFWLYGCRRIEG